MDGGDGWDDQRRRRPTQGGGFQPPLPPQPGPFMQQIEPTQTRVALDIKLFVALLSAILGAGFVAGSTYLKMTYRMEAIESRLSSVATKGDLQTLQYEVLKDIRTRLGTSIVRCPPNINGRGSGAWTECKLIIVDDQQGGRR